ncbi:MED14-domain-containing protein [Meira miltonrushii]|uniref:Mediator of RNA polymerase II transcription subunit 14 n=1 Tax=Meira miltonrushii TaxID=1280837 RepID=A0A316V8H5_9BASI|nr:MED14-domain-containing protein [Meira miltonrushii]PWN33328.1 MED14-domain-containing protein [Meira miltonrushii]
MSGREKAKEATTFNGPFKFPMTNVNNASNKSINGVNGTHDTGNTNDHSTNTIKYDILFQPKYTRAWEKSRKIESNNDTIPTREELDAQLRPEDEGLVPLNAIAGRIVHYAWQLFANQVEINPSISPLERRKRIYDDAHEARKQLIKLLVLTQWSKASPELQVARNLIAFINDHIAQSEAALDALQATRGVLNNARLRNYDLKTAIEVLSTGSPQSVPPSVKPFLNADKPFSNEEAIALVKELDDVLRLRLACEEFLATPLLSYTISDGRACFVAYGLFETDLTLSGSSQDDRWFCLRVKFDFHISGAGSDKFPRQLKGQQRLDLLDLANNELAPRSIAAVTEAQEQITEGDETVQNAEGHAALSSSKDTRIEERKDTPLIRLYNLLQSQSLHYRLDILHWQATQLIKLSWGQRLTVFIDSMRTLHIQYWKNARSSTDNAKEDWDPIARAEICVSVIETDPRQGASAVIKSLFERSDDRMQKPISLQLSVEWNVKGVIIDYLGSREITVDHRNLDAEAILIDVTQMHAKAAVEAFKTRIEASALRRTMRTEKRLKSVGPIEEYGLLIHVNERLTVELTIDRMSGQVQLAEVSGMSEGLRDETLSCSDLARMARTDYVREACKAINERPRSIIGILQRLRCQILIEDLEEKCNLNGLECSTRMPLRQIDYAQLQATPNTLLFIAMQQCPTYYLVVQVAEDCFRVALMCVGTFLEEMITSMRIVSLERLDWMYVLKTCQQSRERLGKRKRDDDVSNTIDMLSMSEDDLAILHSYSVALVSYHKIEEQLRLRGVPYVHVGGMTKQKEKSFWSQDDQAESPDSEDSVSTIVPSLCIDARMLLGNLQGSYVKRNILLRLRNWNDPVRSRVELALKVTLRSGIVSRTDIVEGRNKIHYDTKAGILVFSISEIETYFEQFLTTWRRIEKVLNLLKTLWILGQYEKSGREHQFDFRLHSFDLVHATFTYDQGLMAKIGWIHDPAKRRNGSFALAFDTIKSDDASAEETRRTNPHAILRFALEQALNRGNEAKPNFWLSFLMLLRRTLPLARLVCGYPNECLESIETPELGVRSASWIQLTFLDRFKLDVRLLTANRVLFVDAGRATSHRRGKEEKKSNVEDEFTLHSSSRDVDMDDLDEAILEWSAIPSFDKIIQELAGEILQKGAKKDAMQIQESTQGRSNSVLTFADALLYRGNSDEVEWILKELISKVQKVIFTDTNSIDG